MRLLIIILLFCMPFGGMAQDSIKIEARRLTQKQIDSIIVATKGRWYLSPTIMDNSIKNLLIKLNEEVIKGNEQNRVAFGKQDSLSRIIAFEQDAKLQAIIDRNEQFLQTQRTQQKLRFYDHCLIVFFCILLSIFIIQNIIGVVRRYRHETTSS